ncbi:MAG: hypothetical protein IIZ08_08060, partial [Clostridia bacterium]|nr:hypothetical protein [Clostridia bacterium]
MASNFDFMSPKWSDIAGLGAKAEECGQSSPYECAVLLGKIGERVADELLAVNGLTLPEDSSQSEKIKFLRGHQLIIVSIEDILILLNDISDETEITPDETEKRLRMAHKLCHWFVLVHGYNDGNENANMETEVQPESEELSEEAEIQPESDESSEEAEIQPESEELSEESEVQPESEE